MRRVYEELKEEFKKMVLTKGELSRSEIAEWCRENSVGVLTLTAIIEDLEKNGIVKAVYDTETDSIVLIDLPKCVKACVRESSHRKIEVPAQRKTPKDRGPRKILQSTRRRRQVKKKGKSIASLITHFLEEEKETNNIKVEHVGESKLVAEEVEENEEFFKNIEDEEYRKALMYLAKYRSVGEIRFALDLKKNGVEDVYRLVKRMIEDGYAERSPLGVINATEKLPKIKAIFTLSDILS
mgnify:CR=1 FL=1